MLPQASAESTSEAGYASPYGNRALTHAGYYGVMWGNGEGAFLHGYSRNECVNESSWRLYKIIQDNNTCGPRDRIFIHVPPSVIIFSFIVHQATNCRWRIWNLTLEDHHLHNLAGFEEIVSTTTVFNSNNAVPKSLKEINVHVCQIRSPIMHSFQ